MTQCNDANQHPVGNHSGEMSEHLGLVLHVQEGDGSLHEYFNNPANQVSSTFWVAKTGTIEQYVDGDYVAWAQAAGNGTYNSVETEGHPGEPLTAAQIDALAKLFRWGHDTYGWPYEEANQPGQRGLAWHGMGGAVWGGHDGCPGDIRKGQRGEILTKAAGGQPVPPGHGGEPAPPFPGRLFRLTNPMMSGGDIQQWQARMAQRGWQIAVDGVYGPASENVASQFQREKGFAVDGIVGPQTWGAAWTEPIT